MTRTFLLFAFSLIPAIVTAEAEMGEKRLKSENLFEQETRQQTSDIESKAIVFFYRNREFYGKLLKPVLYCDGIQLAKIANGRYFIAKVDPGPHVFRSKGKDSFIEMDLIGGKTYYIQVVPIEFRRTQLFVTHRVEAVHAIGILEPLQAKFVLDPEMLLDPNDPSLGEVKVGSLVPGEALGSPLLQGDTENQIFSIDQAQFPGCDTRRIVMTCPQLLYHRSC